MVPSLPFWAERLRDVIRWLANVHTVCTEVTEMATSGDECSAEIDFSTRSSSELSLHYSSSPFDEHSVSPESGAETEGHAIEPYMYEPDCNDDQESPTHSEDKFGTHRLDNNDWCALTL